MAILDLNTLRTQINNDINTNGVRAITGAILNTQLIDMIDSIEADYDAITSSFVSADGSINTHSDVDIVTSTPSIGEGLLWDGSKFVPGSISVSLTDGNGTTANGSSVDLGGVVNNNIEFTPDLEANARNFSFGGAVSERFANTNFFNTASFNTDVDDGLGNSSKIIQNSTSLSLRSGLVFQPGNFVELQGYNIQTVSQDFTITLGANGQFKASADYSADYTDRSFVDKEFVDNSISGISLQDGNGTLGNGLSVDLGGDLKVISRAFENSF